MFYPEEFDFDDDGIIDDYERAEADIMLYEALSGDDDDYSTNRSSDRRPPLKGTTSGCLIFVPIIIIPLVYVAMRLLY